MNATPQTNQSISRWGIVTAIVLVVLVACSQGTAPAVETTVSGLTGTPDATAPDLTTPDLTGPDATTPGTDSSSTIINEDANVPTIDAFNVTQEQLSSAGDVTLNWDVKGADSVTINDVTANGSGKGSATTNVGTTKTFVLTAKNASGSSTRTIDVMVGKQGAKAGVWEATTWNNAVWQ
jgi:hypothetical protein